MINQRQLGFWASPQLALILKLLNGLDLGKLRLFISLFVHPDLLNFKNTLGTNSYK